MKNSSIIPKIKWFGIFPNAETAYMLIRRGLGSPKPLCRQYIWLLSVAILLLLNACGVNESVESTNYPTALVSFDDYKQLLETVESHRKERLINLDTFLAYSKAENTIILDTRAKFRFERKHLAGATHLAFTEFTQPTLETLIPDKNTRILIYCNNNFAGDQVDFMSKTLRLGGDSEILPNRTSIMLALNIPTYLNLFGYGYENVFELNELVDVDDPRVEFAGTMVRRLPQIPSAKLNLIGN